MTDLGKLRELLAKRPLMLRDESEIMDALPALLDEVEKLRAALRGLYDQLDSLEDFKFSRDLSPSEAQMNFDDARLAARKALGETK